MMIWNARAAVGVIVIFLAGCDNVSWGGADIAVVPPPPKATELPAGSEEAGVEPLPDQPILYYVARSGDGGFLTPIGQITGDSIAPIRAAGDPTTYGGRFIAEFMRQGAEFTLFTGGRRAGTFIVQSATLPQTPSCPLLPTATGSLEMSGTITATEFLALARADAPSAQARLERPHVPAGIRNPVAPILADRALRTRRAELPGNWVAALKQVTAFPLSADLTGYAATLLLSDSLGVGGDNLGYSLFYVFVPTPGATGYDTVFVNYRNYAETGKAAPRVVDYLDWTRDETPELLLQVFGIAGSWFEAVARSTDGTWRRVFQDRCEEGSRTLPTPPPPRDTTRIRR